MRSTALRHVFFFIILIVATLAFLGVIRDFIQPLFWAVVLAILFRPLHKRWLIALNGKASLASACTMISIVIIVLLPLFLLGLAVTREAISVYEGVAAGEIDLQEPLEMLENATPLVTEYMERLGIDTDRIRENLSSAAVAVSRYLASQALAIGQNALRITLLSFVMLYVLFFFLRDGTGLVDTMIRVLPLGNDREKRLFGKFAEVARATIKGTLLVGLAQGTLGGLIFWILGIPAPVLWGMIMTVLSLLPAVGAAIIWVPAAIVLMVSGSIVKGIVLIAFGAGVISLVDNFLRPILVGRDTKMPDYVILIATLGGLTVYGISGFVIGPVIAALFIVVWQMFEEEYAWEKGPVEVESIKDAAVHPHEHGISVTEDPDVQDMEESVRRDQPPTSGNSTSE